MMDFDNNSIKNFSLPELEKWVIDKGFPAYRGRQIFQWMYSRFIDNAETMQNLPKGLRKILVTKGNLQLSEALGEIGSSVDKTQKILFKLQDGNYVEAVLIYGGDRRTVCLSSQVGCALACGFCQTGKMGFIRNLSVGEILDQLLKISQISKDPITNIVFMGMGEPFLNYEKVMKAAKIINHKDGFNIGARRITLSTAGIIPKIREFADSGFQFKLAISLNSPFQEIREKIMPVSKKYNLKELIKSSKYYTYKTNKRITFEYVLLKDVNDTKADAEALIKLLHSIPCKLNLIPFNETDTDFDRPDNEGIQRFESWFEKANFPVIVRWSGGKEIDAACGQLYYDKISKI